MKTLIIHDRDYNRAVKLLIENGIQPKPEANIPLIRKSSAKPGETPTAFGGIWEDDERTMESIRAQAWPKRR